ncbi:MAG: hypothetical protein PHO26_00670 [Dehalococcoidia bacterium]|nr:hypothetical protein [Dehalococcoidia bacterium]MDD5494371.1 hypothetical protein [Dehalococcoidia bacterium]
MVSNRFWFADYINRGSHKIRIALKYCGSCNPEIDLSALGAEVRRFIARRESFELVPHDDLDIDILIVLCGCQRACADREDIKSHAKHSLVTAGEGLRGSRVPYKDLAAILAAEIELLNSSESD